MSNELFHNLQCKSKEVKVVAGSFRPNGSSAIDVTLNTGNGFTVVRTAAGVYTITFSAPYCGCVSLIPALQLASVANCMVQLGAIDVVTGKTAVINALQSSDGTTAVDIASNASNRIHFVAFLRNTSLTK
jgi:hypothetical protein